MTTAPLICYLTLGSLIALAACRDSSAAPAHQPPVPADARAPLPLSAMMASHQKREMRDHLRVVQEIAGGLARDDFDAIAKSAARIAWSDEQAAKCKHMGAGAPGFAAMGEHFHRTADQLGDAARRRDRPGVVRALDATLQTCVGCHESYRQDIVADDAAPGKAGMDSCPMHGR
jgi:hypothetical protein